MARKLSNNTESAIIYESSLLKRGKYQNTFKEKWFVLLENSMLIYYSSQKKSKTDSHTCDGTINLKDVNNFTVIHNGEIKKLDLKSFKSTYLRIVKSPLIDSEQNNIPFALQLDTKERTYIFGIRSRKNIPAFKQWILYFNDILFGGIIYSGYLMKQGGKWKSWKKRWFHLDKNALLLKYYESHALEIWKGAIDLSAVQNLCRGDKDANGKDYTIELNTDDRVWILAAETANMRDDWIEKLKNIIENKEVYTVTKNGRFDKLKETGTVKPKTPRPRVKGVRFKTNALDKPKVKGVRFKPYNLDKVDSVEYESASETPVTRISHMSIVTAESDSGSQDELPYSLDQFDGSLNPLNDHHIPFNPKERFGSAEQISVEQWKDNTPSLMDGSNVQRGHAYKFTQLQTQFLDVQCIDLEDMEEIKGQESVSLVREDELEDIRDAMNADLKEERMIEFDARFKKIYAANKLSEIDMGKVEKNMVNLWNECLSDVDTDISIESEMRYDDIKTDNCVCRVGIILQYYYLWVYKDGAKDQSISDVLHGKLNKFSFVLLLNDFCHIKRDYGNQLCYLKLFVLQQTNVKCNIESCLLLLRCNRDKLKMTMSLNNKRRNLYYFLEPTTDNEQNAYEVVLQQLLDSIYCFIFYGSYFNANDSNTLTDTINVYEKHTKTSETFPENILRTYKCKNDLELGNKFQSQIKHELPCNNGNNNKSNIFGVNMRYGTRIEMYYMFKFRPYFNTMKDELFGHQTCGVSYHQWDEIIQKSDTFKKTFMGKQLLCKHPNENERNLCENKNILDIHIIALMFYSHFNKLKKSLLDSYHMIDSNNSDDVRLKHYNYFFHFGRLILESVKLFGDNLYENESQTNLNSLTYYHGINMQYENVIKMGKFSYNTYGLISVTNKPLVSFLYNDNIESSVLELDLNGGSLFSENLYCFDLSFISDCPYEYEHIFDGGLCFGIRNVISLGVCDNKNDYYLWFVSIFLLRVIVGDVYWKLNASIDDYFINTLCKNQTVCERLLELITNEMESSDTESTQNIPKYITEMFHSYCDNIVGYCYINYHRILYLSKGLQNLFLLNEYECINCKFLLRLLPNINFIYGLNFIFDDTFCKHMIEYLSDEKQNTLNRNRLMYIQFEQFERQQQINKKYFTEEIMPLIQKYKGFNQQWSIKKSKKWECIKFERAKI